MHLTNYALRECSIEESLVTLAVLQAEYHRDAGPKGRPRRRRHGLIESGRPAGGQALAN